jgi:hypothetical protein
LFAISFCNSLPQAWTGSHIPTESMAVRTIRISVLITERRIREVKTD